ncbi:putative toxin [Paraburkholderia kururiensis]|uniref:Toxin n=1 Tax=Paraburkholderia kururiensis TaxID=984307 RepID=A0ABZ0WDT6_9BURK|nr:putative toxin [Paraburkholderia kururiensis]WQD75500.1 putative toxin [Paraburkholderia kururiensis]
MRTTGKDILRRAMQRTAARDSARFAHAEDLNTVRPALWRRVTAAVMVVVTYFAPAVFLADATAHAAPIVDPRAPITFQPTITQSSAGVPVINIPAPNAQGISASQLQSLSAGSEGLIFNNSLVAGTSLIGGQVGSNPNLAGRTASVILAQVISTGRQYASVIAGPLEIFGNSASLIIANPNGISVPGGTALTNISNLTLTTGTPQFITAAGGTPTDFAHAGALAWSVNGGNISINGPPGNDGTPGAGIEGTVGNIDLIGETVSLAAPLNANNRVNIVTGDQLVTPTSSGATGTTWTTSSNGSANTATTSGAVAIDASRYGSVTSGQVYIVSTAAGMGVNMQGPLAATAGNVTVTSNGDIAVGGTSATGNVSLASQGNTTVSGTGVANQNYTVSATGDINVTGSASAGQDATLNAGGSLNVASVAANGNSTLTAGNSMTVGSVSGQNLSLKTTTGDITVNSGLTAPGTIAANAGRDLTVNGAVNGGSTVGLAAARNAAINGAVSGVGDTTIIAQAGTANVSGSATSNGALILSSAQGTTLGGTAQAQGPVTISSQSGPVTGSGNVASSQGAVSLAAGQDIGLTGSVQAGTTVTATAGGNASLGGTVTAPGAISVTAGGNSALGGNATSGSTLTVTSGGSTAISGSASSVGDMSLAANGGTLSTTGSVTTLGNLTANGQQGVNLGGNVYSQGNAQIGSGVGNVAVAGTLTTPGTATISAGQDVTVSGNAHSGGSTSIAATRDVTLNGGLEADGTSNATVTAGRDITGSGAVGVANDTMLSAGRNIDITGAIQTGNNLAATAGTSLSVGATTAVGTETLTATNGSATLGGNALSGGAMNVTAGTGISAQGTVQSLGDLGMNAKGGDLTAASTVSTAGNATLNAGGNLNLNGQTTVSKDATLTGANITTQGVAVGGNLNATATQNLDTSAGQLNATYSPSAPALSVNGDATLKGANVTTANAVIGGTYSATGTTGLTTGGTAAYMGNATLAGGTVTNVGSQMAKGNLAVSGSNVSNQGSLSSLATMAVSAANLTNTGTIYGPTNAINVSGGTTNTGGLLATSALNLVTGALNNSSGLIYTGDVNNPGAAAGDVTVTVNGGNGTFNNTNGQILAQHNLTLYLPNQAFDPSAAASGTLNLGNVLTINAQQLNNSGTWAMPGNNVSINAAQGFTNTGTISKSGDITLSTSGTLSNSGTITAGNNVNLSGTVVNQAGGTIHADNDVNLTGVATNAGTVSAVRDVNVNGSSYDNSGAVTAAGRNFSANLSGDLANTGGTITAQNDVTINAANVLNNRAGANSTTTTSMGTTISATGLGSALLSAPLGLLTLDDLSTTPDGSTADYRATITGRVGDLQLAGTNTATAPDLSSGALYGIALPTVTRTITTTQPSGAAGVIAAGHDLSITTGNLGNHGSTISAGNNATLRVASLDNGGDASITTVTDTIDAASYASFLSQLKAAYQAGTLQALEGTQTVGGSNGAGDVYIETLSINTGTAPPSGQTSTLTTWTSQNAGQIVAGNNLSLTGTGGGLTNAGNLYAAQDLVISAGSFTNQGYHTSNLTSTSGCAAGVAQDQCGMFGVNLDSSTSLPWTFQRPGQAFTNPYTTRFQQQYVLGSYYRGWVPGNDGSAVYGDQTSTQSYSYTQTNNTVFAGRDLIIAAPTVSNAYGNLLAGRDVVIGGSGTSRDNTNLASPQTTLTQAGSLTNSSGNIQAGRDMALAVSSLVNTLTAPAQIYQNYGTTARYGCSGASYHFCDAFVDVQSGDASTITANRNLSVSAGTVTNTGSLITAGSQATVTASSGITNQDQTLNAYWHDAFNGGVIGGSMPPDNFGCGTSGNCSTLFGSAYRSGDGVQPPTPYQSLPGTIQAPSLTVTAGGALQNSGNVMGQQVSLTGASLVNGLTSPGAYTPQPTVSQQVIPLGPPGVPVIASTALNGANGVNGAVFQPSSIHSTVGLSAGTAIGDQSVGVPGSPAVSRAGVPSMSSVQAVNGQASVSPSYLLNNPASQVIASVGPAQLIANLPANLQPSSSIFYYDPFTEDQVLQQAALNQTGQASFISGLTYDSQNQKSVTDQEKSVLYANAIQYAESHNVALGTALSQQQIASLDAPMLWYVEETVPEPGCTATGTVSCPTVNALMPQVYLPQNYAVVEHDGAITGQNVTLTASNGGTITNTGAITATDSLTVNAGTLTNQQRSTDIGTQYTMVGPYGLLTTTGTVTQQGGFMSAGNYDLNVDRLEQIGGALQKLSTDGSIDTAGTTQQLAALKAQLGSSFVQGTATNDLHTSFTSLADSPGAFEMIGMAVTVVVASFITAGLASAMMGPVMAGTVGGSMVSAGAAGFVGSAVSQASTGQFSFTTALEGGAVGAVTAGLTNGITYSADNGFGWSGLGAKISDNSLSALAGVKNVGGVLVPQAGATTASTIGQVAVAMGAEATIQAGVQTAIQGGSFLTNLRNSAVSDLAAAAAYGIGNAASVQGSPIAVGTPGYWLAHAALGCAASAAEGTGCAGGAIGGATSAVLSPWVIGQIDPTGKPLDPGQAAAVAALATLSSGTLAGLLGQNVQGAMTAAQNEAINNAAKHIGGVNPDAATHDPGMQGYDAENDTHRVLPSSGGVANEAEAGDNVTVGQGTPVGAGAAAYAPGQASFQRGIQFQGDALSALGLPENTVRITVTLPNGSPVTVVPDAVDGSTIIEVKDVANLSNSNQFRGYLATGNPIQLIVSPNTKTISQPLQNLINNSGGSIRVFNPATGTFRPWTSK